MIMRSLQPRFARHLMGFPHTDFGSLVQALYGIEEGIARGLWSESSPTDSKGKRPSGGQRSGDVGAISSAGMRPSRHYQTVGQTPGEASCPIYSTPSSTDHYLCAEATTSVCSVGYAFESSFSEARRGWIIDSISIQAFTPTHTTSLQDGLTLFLPSGTRHDTDHCIALRHAIQDLIDQGLVNLGQPSVTTNPLPAHSTHAVHPSLGDIHHMDLIEDDSIHMLSWDDGLPEPIVLHDSYEIDGVSLVPQAPAPFSLIPDGHHSNCDSRIAQPPPPAVRPFEGTTSHEEVRREDDEVLRQLQSTQARISIWSLLASSNTHRDALIRALSQIRVETTTTPEGLIHMMTAGRATCIVFSDDDLPPDGLDHVRPLYITVGCSGRRVPSVLLDNGSALNVCPLATAIALGFAPSDFGPSTQTVRAYDSTKREVMGTLMIDLQIGPATFSTLFQVLRILASFNLLLGRPWIHVAGAIPSSLHQKVKFIHDGQVITVRSTRDIFASYEPVLQISHSEDDLLLTGSTVVLDMMRGMTFLPGMGLGRRQQGSSEFIAAIDHDTTFGLGFIPTEADYRHMARLRKERVRARLSHTPFDYPIRPYRMSLTDYFVRGSETRPRLEEIDSVAHTDRETELQHLFHQLQLSDGVIVDPTEVIDGVVPHDEYRDEMDMMTGTQTLPVPELPEDDSSLFEGIVSPVEGASDLVDPPLSFDVLSGFVSRSDDIFDIDDEIAHPSSDRDSFDHDSGPIDERVSPAAGDVETVDFGTEDQPRELKIGSPLSTDERDRLIHLLRSYLDVFAWSYEDMPGLDPSIVKEEIQKQLSVGFISVVEYPEWLANVVPVPKKDGKVRVCVDFRDLNKASPKDDFPLPHIDLLVDGTAGHSMLSFMDGFSGYNQILMAPEDMEKTTFITEWGTYCYRVMPFGLKNAGATYQRAATTLFHDMMHRDVEVYVDDMIVKSRARLTDICEPIFRLLRKNQPTVWNDDCQFAFEKIKEYLLSPPVLVPPTPGRPLLLYLSVSDMALGCMLAQIDDLGKERAIYYLKFDIQYVSQKSIKGSIVADHLASLPTSEDRPVDDDFPDEEFVAMTSLSGWCMYFDGAANQSGYGIGVLLVSPQGDHIPRWRCLVTPIWYSADSGDWKTRDVKLRPYHAYLELLVARFDDLRYVHLPRAQNRFADALATLASSVDIPIDVVIRPLLIDHCQGSESTEAFGTRFVICGDTLYRRSADGMLLLCLDRASADRVMREVHSGVCGPHMGGHMLAIHGDLIHAPPSELHALTSPWPFSVWGIDIIGKVSPKSSSGHEFILVAIDYFTKWVEAASYARGAHFRAEVDTLLQEYGIRHHRSSAYRPQTNGAVEAANKNIKRILRKMELRLPLVYGMEAVLPVETEMGSLRVALEQQISETEWAQARFDQLNLLDERRLRAADHVQAYQRKMARAFKKRLSLDHCKKGT
ncbi:Transposon Ty3-I Gag-Pol polyprotein [Vitis vinifera]|uniref:Transposon Ty3-I Gag-Pol polyprotein n=1 Tax=Vitis vinifera TaxID=29760 RepID=A0A438G8L7_VITVI|nr:Transposon Ty3-I Gag-Pol polyprotein [Vitis vinifera]